MKTTTILTIGTAILISTAISQADITLKAPGATSAIGTSTPGSLTLDAGNHKKYEITGYAVDAGQTNQGLSVSASVNGTRIFSGISLVKKGGVSVVTLDTPIVIKDANAIISLSYDGSEDPKSGVSVEILATITDATVEPVGTLKAPLVVKNDGLELPLLNWSISKFLDNEAVTPPSTGGGNEDESSSEDAANVGKGKSNNGHGNNLDGIDVSNPGKSAEKWASYGKFDTDYNGDGEYEDDEGRGGGSAMSNTPVKNTVSQ
ncbi:hypothetical protein HW115_02315 [Verrucomicrobiaceae bacterium N1E253]|uniref:Uncharacterized protein n=1 Tax=Oceaniferula marina TaxID=2748318 RepID=A0A851G9N6_9BACT|nr:hypothetical protein [Oceaniferula marina]NWK54428.1 hypothetical protein [Oceaniferula marina]